MNSQQIESVVTLALQNASEMYLQEIVSHGIHNLTNDFHGQTDDDFEAFAAEFENQAKEMLNKHNEF